MSVLHCVPSRAPVIVATLVTASLHAACGHCPSVSPVGGTPAAEAPRPSPGAGKPAVAAPSPSAAPAGPLPCTWPASSSAYPRFVASGDYWKRTEPPTSTWRPYLAMGVRTTDGEAVLRKAPVLRLARVSSTHEECSGAGGTHMILELCEPPGAPRLGTTHLGGHAVYLFGQPKRPGSLYVVGLVPGGWRGSNCRGNPDCGIRGWCLDRVPETGARTLAAMPVATRAAGEALLRKLAAPAPPRARPARPAP